MHYCFAIGSKHYLMWQVFLARIGPATYSWEILSNTLTRINLSELQIYPLLISTTKAIPEMKNFLVLSSTEWTLDCAGCAWVYVITWDTLEDTVWKAHIPPIPNNISAIAGVSFWPRTSILDLNCLLASCISMKIFHFWIGIFSWETVSSKHSISAVVLFHFEDKHYGKTCMLGNF